MTTDGSPKTVSEALSWLEVWFNTEDLATFREHPEDKLFQCHHTIGRKLRNGLRLWHDEHPPIWHHFVDVLNIDHPDDMSSILLTSFHRYLNDKPIDLPAQVCKVHEYWAAGSDRKTSGTDSSGPV